ncbi:MAG: hypothetical protein ABIO88_15110 [Burkholderiaceae bacterium]
MKLKKQYAYLLSGVVLPVAIAAFSIYYIGYGWVFNPWADDRLVWDTPSPELIGKTFSITGRAAYKNETESLPLPVKNFGAIGYIWVNPENIQGCAPIDTTVKVNNDGNGVVFCDNAKIIVPTLIEPAEVFTIEKTYFIHRNFMSKAFRSDYRAAVVSNKKGEKFNFTFFNFRATNIPHLMQLDSEKFPYMSWDFHNTEIAYNSN